MIAGIPKRALRKYFYQFRLPIAYKKAVQAVAACVSETSLPKGVQAHDLVTVKRALEAWRQKEGTILKQALEAETALLETAAEMGDRTAIALLCGARLSEKTVSPQDWEDGSRLLKQLMDAKFALAFKVSGDLAYRLGQLPQASKFYRLAIQNKLDDNRLQTECWRNIGHISFQTGDLATALASFSAACSGAQDQRQVADCHFYLAQLREANRYAARTHLETAAFYGLSDAFVPLAMLLLNYFGEAHLAKHWLTLALVTDKTGAAAVGLFDAAMRLNDYVLAQSALGRIRAHTNARELEETRKETIRDLEAALSEKYTIAGDRWSF